uniref:Uncharacterized protein n=1 Tax=Acrobeloides nanus TaxID=290746 RepID=A0A914D9D8_9BILA
MYNHLKVNHVVHYKDPESGACTNCIEAHWRSCKATIAPSGHRFRVFLVMLLAIYSSEDVIFDTSTKPKNSSS